MPTVYAIRHSVAGFTFAVEDRGGLGPVVVWSRLWRPGACLPACPACVGEAREWLGTLRAYIDGSVVDLSRIRIDTGNMTPFQRSVTAAARGIAAGRTLTYAELASAAAHEGAARAAASVMRRNPFPLIVPCHRVVARSGIGGFMGHRSGWQVKLKRRLLALEGVKV